MDPHSITTCIDDLIKYLNEHGETDSRTLANALKVSEEMINAWVDVLEEAHAVKIDYKLDKMFISTATEIKEEDKVASKMTEEEKKLIDSGIISPETMEGTKEFMQANI
jgi:DeoR/GlpR family transcriptional regulator of sugar metabolism